MRKLHIEDVIREMEYGQVAIKYSGEEGYLDDHVRYIKEDSYIYFDEDDHGILKSSSGLTVAIAKPRDKREKFVILDKDVFEKVKEMGTLKND